MNEKGEPDEVMHLSCMDRYEGPHLIYIVSAVYGRRDNGKGRGCEHRAGDTCVQDGTINFDVKNCNHAEDCVIEGLPLWLHRCNAPSQYLNVAYVCVPGTV